MWNVSTRFYDVRAIQSYHRPFCFLCLLLSGELIEILLIFKLEFKLLFKFKFELFSFIFIELGDPRSIFDKIPEFDPRSRGGKNPAEDIKSVREDSSDSAGHPLCPLCRAMTLPTPETMRKKN